jgi:hypothetical protein
VEKGGETNHSQIGLLLSYVALRKFRGFSIDFCLLAAVN